MENLSMIKDDINKLSEEDQERLLICYGDGQGDTYCRTLKEAKKGFNDDDLDFDNVQTVISFYEEHGGNMVELVFIQNNLPYKVTIID